MRQWSPFMIKMQLPKISSNVLIPCLKSHKNNVHNIKLFSTSRLFEEPPYMMLKKNSPFLTGNDRFEGYVADMIARLAAGKIQITMNQLLFMEKYKYQAIANINFNGFKRIVPFIFFQFPMEVQENKYIGITQGNRLYFSPQFKPY